jgi:hypothetical protein
MEVPIHRLRGVQLRNKGNHVCRYLKF